MFASTNIPFSVHPLFFVLRNPESPELWSQSLPENCYSTSTFSCSCFESSDSDLVCETRNLSPHLVSYQTSSFVHNPLASSFILMSLSNISVLWTRSLFSFFKSFWWKACLNFERKAGDFVLEFRFSTLSSNANPCPLLFFVPLLILNHDSSFVHEVVDMRVRERKRSS